MVKRLFVTKQFPRSASLFFVLALLMSSHFGFGQVDGNIIISEFMSSNSSTLMDEDSDYSDWIELHNPSSQDLDISGWYLSDNSENLIKWLLPNYTISANGFLIIFASGKDKKVTEWHTNFKLSSAGEQLFLVGSDGKTIISSVIDYPPQETDVSYSFVNESWIFSDPTPGGPNAVGSYLNPPKFSVKHGLFDQPFTLAMSNATGDSILYTIDGSNPGLDNGIKYLSPIQIDSTYVIRAVAFSGPRVSNSSTSTYIFPAKVRNQAYDPEGYPFNWGSFSRIDGNAPADYGMDPIICNDPDYSGLIEPALKSIPTISLSTSIGYLFSHSTDPVSGGIYVHTDSPTGGFGEDWERPASAELLIPGGSKGFQINCGIRIHGGHSRVPEKNPKHSFRLVFRDQYGPSKLNCDVFENGSSNEFNSIVLRAGFNHSWLHWDTNQRNVAQYIRDSWAKDTWHNMGHTAANNKFVHLYINGLYWGLYNISERMDDDFVADYLGGDKEDWDVIKDYAEVAEGNKEAWNTMMGMAEQGLSDADSYNRIQGKNAFGEIDENLEAFLDVENLIDYMLLNFYAGNLDWDHHNWVAARNRVNPGKGFQFFPWDSERIFYNTSNNVVDEMNEDKPSFLYTQLRHNPMFRIQFARRANELLGPGGLLSPDSVKAAWTKRSKEIELAVIAESARWGDYRKDMHQYNNGPYDLYTKKDHWDVELERLLNDYFPKRSQIVLEQLKEIGLAGEVITGTEPNNLESRSIPMVYPMPFTNQVSIKFNINHPGNAELFIFSSDGKMKHHSRKTYVTGGEKQLSWQPESEMSGIYFYQIRNDDAVYSGKLIYIQ